MRSPDIHRRSVLTGGSPASRRPWRVVRAVVLAVLGTVALLVGGLWTFLETRQGGELLRKVVVARANRAIAGQLAIGGLSFGGDRLVLDRVTLRDPEGAVVARIGHLDLKFSPLALLRRHLNIPGLVIDQPELLVAADGRGLNLTRAIAPRHPAATPPASKRTPAEAEESPGVTIDLHALRLDGGRVEYRGDGAERVHLRALAVRGAFQSGRDALSAHATIDAAGGHVELRATFDPRRRETGEGGILVRARDLDLREWLTGVPASDLAFELRARGGIDQGTRARSGDTASVVDALDGSLDFYLPPGKLDGGSVGPIGLTVRGRQGRYELANLLAVLPGVRATGNGTVFREQLDTHLRVEATDLAALSRALTGHAGTPPLALAGRGRVDVELGGTLRAPSLKIAAQAPWARLGTNSVQALTASIDVPDLNVPEAANVDVRAPVAALSGQELRGIALSLQASGRRISGAARIAAPYPLALSLAGEHPGPSRRLIRLSALTLRYPEASWSLAAPALLQLGGDRVFVRNLSLGADRQSIRVDAQKTDRAVDVRLRIAHFDLARLPHALVPKRLAIGGTVDADLRVNGRPEQPRIDVTAALGQGRLRGYRDLGLHVDAHKLGPRARGDFELAGLGTSTKGTFDIPTEWPPRGRERRLPLRLDLALAETDLAALLKALRDAGATGAPSGGPHGMGAAGVRGRGHFRVRLDGTAAAPRLAIEAGARGLVVREQRVGDVSLTVNADDDRPMAASLEIARALQLEATTSLTLREVARRPPTAETLARAHFEVNGHVQRFPVATLAALGASLPPPVGGTISAQLAASGTANAPRGKVTIDIDGASSGRFPATDGRVELAADSNSVDARVRVVRKGHPLLAATASIGAGIEALRRSPAAVASAPVQVRAVLGPLALHRLGLPPDNDRSPPRELKGQVHADVTIEGTARAPRLLAHLQAADLRLDKSLVGAGEVTARYANRRATVDAHLTSPNQGQLTASVATNVDLGYPAVAAGLDTHRLPIEARLESRGFDLAGLSGATQQLRTVAGQLDASAVVDGTVVDPTVSGRIEWKNGTVAITGLGEYRSVHLALHGDRSALTLDELSAQSGGGKARLTGNASHAPGRGYQLDSRASLDHFPIYKEGQALATVSLDAGIKGTISPARTRLNVAVEETRVALSDAKRKDLQPLAAPKDVILTEDGQPLNRAQAQRARALAALQKADDQTTNASSGGNVAQGSGSGKTAASGDHPGATPVAPKTTIAVKAERRLWVTGKDAYIELGLGPDFRVVLDDEPRVFGQVVVRRGRINVMGRRFDLMPDSTLQFGGPPDQPELDVRAQHKNYQANITVLLTAKGPLDHLSIQVSAPERPDLTESQLYTLIITGHLQFGDGSNGPSTPADQAASLLGGVIASQLQKTLGNKLPLDVLTIDAGTGTSMTGTQLEAGRYVTQKLYVGYVGRLGADPSRYENANAVHVEYQLTRHWEIEGEYGDVGTGTADLMWKKSY